MAAFVPGLLSLSGGRVSKAVVPHCMGLLCLWSHLRFPQTYVLGLLAWPNLEAHRLELPQNLVLGLEKPCPHGHVLKLVRAWPELQACRLEAVSPHAHVQGLVRALLDQQAGRLGACPRGHVARLLWAWPGLQAQQQICHGLEQLPELTLDSP